MTIKNKEFITEIFLEEGPEAHPVAMGFAYTEEASVNEAIAHFNSFDDLIADQIFSIETHEIPQHLTANEMA